LYQKIGVKRVLRGRGWGKRKKLQQNQEEAEKRRHCAKKKRNKALRTITPAQKWKPLTASALQGVLIQKKMQHHPQNKHTKNNPKNQREQRSDKGEIVRPPGSPISTEGEEKKRKKS